MSSIFDSSNYNYQIPLELIAQKPPEPRDSSRLLVWEREKSLINTRIFKDILDFFEPGDVLVLNNTKVIKARLKGFKEQGGKIEVLLLKEDQPGLWQALVKPAKRARINSRIIFPNSRFSAQIVDKPKEGIRLLSFKPKTIAKFLPKLGKVPLPPYIKKETGDFGYYQTVYAKKQGAIAAPTAGLHFTPELIAKLREKGVKIVYITLHCGLATFKPLKTEDIRDHKIESEAIEVSETASRVINSAKFNKKRVFAVGTTAVRALESSCERGENGSYQVKPFSGETKLYIVPGYKFKIIDALITNFHTPLSTNLVLVCAFCGLKPTQKAYQQAKKARFQFWSFGDAMLIL